MQRNSSIHTMKKFTTVFALFLAITLNAQDKATIQGLVTDKEMNNEPLPFANVFVKGTAIGVTTDFDGNYSFSVDEGVVVVVFSFVGYQTVEVPLTVVDGESYTLNQLLGASEGITMDEVVVQAIVSKEKETALLVEQKKAVVIKESIGAQRLAKVGVSNAAAATTKIAGVTKNESSSAVFIRGLGDRYLSTTMNGLPIPSDDVENKNINLNLFSTGIIQNVGISKTYTTSNYTDQASGSVDIISKKYTKNSFSLGLKTGANTNVLKGSVKDNFRVTQNYEDLTVGFHSKQHTLKEAITEQSWNTKTTNPLANFGISVSGGKKFFLGEKDLTVFATASHSKSFSYRQGIFKSYRSNVLNNSYTDTELYRVDINTTGIVEHLGLRLDENNKISYNSLFVNKTQENLFEQGRNGEGYVFDQDPAEYGAFVRDQNTKQTMMYVNQLLAEHRLSENNKLTWAAGMNYVLSEEPNRIRNEVNIEATDLPENVSPLIFTDDNTLQFAHVGDFQQRKSGQKVEDLEYNARIQDEMTFVNLDEDGAFKLRAGANIRHKERTFSSLFIGVRSKGVQAPDVDDLSSVFTQYNFNNRTTILRTPNPDIYLASLDVVAAYANYDFAFGKLSGNIGGRYEFNKIDLEWDVANFSGAPRTSKTYNSILPSLNLKYELNEVQFVRIALSKTNTLPEFKELAPFEYVSPNGRVTKGNPNLEKSDNFNVDLKWEMFPENGGLLSATGFYKQIKNPINLALTRGSSGYFVFDNTGEEATVYGLEFEGRKDIIDTDNSKLNLNVNMTKMWFNQDLKKNFQYKGKTETNLQGASDFILNTALSFSTKSEREFVATTAVNYSSDKIAVLGAPEDQSSSETLYNDEIIEKGFVTLDLVVSKKLSEKLSLRIRGKNLLNPAIEQTQLVRSLVNGVETDETVVSYKKGSQVTLSLAYKF